jgi:hypothetical protein
MELMAAVELGKAITIVSIVGVFTSSCCKSRGCCSMYANFEEGYPTH